MKKLDVIIIGAGISGLTASIYLARAGKSVLVIESNGIGGQIASSPTVENYPGYSKISGIELADKLCEQAENLGVQIDFDTVETIVPGDEILVKTEYSEYSCDNLIIATGAKHRHLNVPGENELAGKGVSYCAICDGALYKNRVAAVAGGGNTALTSALYLAGICKTVYLIHRRDSYRADFSLVNKVKDTANIIPVTGCIAALDGTNELEKITLTDKRELNVDGLFINIGVTPNTEIFRDILPLDENGYIVSDESCTTKYPNIFVSGDVRTKTARQLTTAAADGTVSALNICK